MATPVLKPSAPGVYKRMQRLVSRVIEVLRTGELEYAELQGTLLTGMWGVGLLFVNAPSLEIPPAVLSIGLLAVCGIQLYGIRGMSHTVRRFGAMAAMIMWAFTAGEAADATNMWRYVVCPTCICCVLAAFWGYYRIGRREDLKIARLKFRDIT